MDMHRRFMRAYCIETFELWCFNVQQLKKSARVHAVASKAIAYLRNKTLFSSITVWVEIARAGSWYRLVLKRSHAKMLQMHKACAMEVWRAYIRSVRKLRTATNKNGKRSLLRFLYIWHTVMVKLKAVSSQMLSIFIQGTKTMEHRRVCKVAFAFC